MILILSIVIDGLQYSHCIQGVQGLHHQKYRVFRGFITRNTGCFGASSREIKMFRGAQPEIQGAQGLHHQKYKVFRGFTTRNTGCLGVQNQKYRVFRGSATRNTGCLRAPLLEIQGVLWTSLIGRFFHLKIANFSCQKMMDIYKKKNLFQQVHKFVKHYNLAICEVIYISGRRGAVLQLGR